MIEKHKIYMDFAASTPLDPDVKKAMEPYFSDKFGNPGSLHGFGQEGIKAVDKSRETVAESLGANFREIVFTGSATEANNLCLRGVLRKVRRSEKLFKKIQKPKIIVSSIEHESVLDTAHDLDGVDVVELGVDEKGVVDLNQLKKELDERVVLVSVMYANNEIGTVEPVSEIARIIKEFRDSNDSHLPFFHTDAVQAFQYIDIDVKDLGVDMMTISAHKIYGPKGVGALFIRKPEFLSPNEFLVEPITTGGGQEFALRSGTENTPSIVGFAKAVEIADKKREKESERMAGIGEYFYKKLIDEIEGAKLNGVSIDDRFGGDDFSVLPNIYNVYLPGVNNEEFLIKLDMAGIAVSAGSACSARSVEESHVLKNLGYSPDRVGSSLRFSFGRQTTKETIDESLKRIKNIIKE